SAFHAYVIADFAHHGSILIHDAKKSPRKFMLCLLAMFQHGDPIDIQIKKFGEPQTDAVLQGSGGRKSCSDGDISPKDTIKSLYLVPFLQELVHHSHDIIDPAAWSWGNLGKKESFHLSVIKGKNPAFVLVVFGKG